MRIRFRFAERRVRVVVIHPQLRVAFGSFDVAHEGVQPGQPGLWIWRSRIAVHELPFENLISMWVRGGVVSCLRDYGCWTALRGDDEIPVLKSGLARYWLMMFVSNDTNPRIGGTGIIKTLDKGIYTGG